MTAAPQFVDQIASELNISPRRVTAVVELLEGAATVPFIARYRKEVTGGLDEVAIIAIPGKEKEVANQKFRDYFDWSEPIATAPSHRVLAIRRGKRNSC